MSICLCCLGPKCVPTLKTVTPLSNRDSSQPKSVAVGDLNNDGQTDIVIANTGTDSVGIFLGHGNNSFSNQVMYSTGLDSTPCMVVIGDYNNDGNMDIAVANFGANNIAIMLGNGNGSFKSQIIISTIQSRPLYLAVGDFNHDTKLDIAVANFGTNSIGIILGLGDGKFTRPLLLSTDYDSFPHSVAVGDLNNDNNLDIACTNYGTGSIGIFLGFGNGTFANQMKYTIGLNFLPRSIVIADLNNDFNLDIAVINSGTENIGIFFGYGNGSFAVPTFYTTGKGSDPLFIGIGDFNSDKKLDIVVTNNGTNSMSIFFQSGNGNFTHQSIIPIGPNSNPYSLAIAHFNSDNNLDIAIADWQNSVIEIFNGFSNVTFPRLISSPTIISSVNILSYYTGENSQPQAIAVGDFNNDHNLDILVANCGNNSIGVFLGHANGTFASRMISTTSNGLCPIDVAVGDFNEDRHLDVVVANYYSQNICIFLGYGDGTFTNQTKYKTGNGSNPNSVAIGDFNIDGHLDIVVLNTGTNNMIVFLGSGHGTFTNQAIYFVTSYPNSKPLTVGDFNNDGRLDIAIAKYFAGSVGGFFGYGNGSFTNQKIFFIAVAYLPNALATGDFNQDSYLDIALVSCLSFEEHVLILLGNKYGNFSPSGKYATGVNSAPSSIIVGHFNNDSQLDIAVTNSGTNNIGIFLGFGDGRFAEQITYPSYPNSAPISIAIGDFNHDNLTDLAVANKQACTADVYLAFINSSFDYKASYGTGSAAWPTVVAIGDLTNDGQLSIVVGTDGTKNVHIISTLGNGSFSMKKVYSANNPFQPTSIALQDLNNDNRLDIAISNSIGDNVCVLYGDENITFVDYAAYSTGIGSNPKSIVIGDFNNDYRVDVAVAQPGTHSVGILLQTDDGSMRNINNLPVGVGSKPHGLAVADFDNDGRLDIAVTRNALAQVGLFFGLGNGTFKNQSIISLVTGISPLLIVAADLNNDTRPDMVVTNNANVSPLIILLGNGDGTFKMSEIDVYGGTWAVAISDVNLDSCLDLIVNHPYDFFVTVLLGNGDGTFADITTYSTSVAADRSEIVIGDFNNDGRPDFVTNYLYFDGMGIFLGNGDGTFQDEQFRETGVGTNPAGINAADLNGDGNLDIIIANSGTNCISVLFGYGDGNFADPTIVLTIDKSAPISFVVQDLNKDNRLDITVTDIDTNKVAVLIGYGNGTFGNVQMFTSGFSAKPSTLTFGTSNTNSSNDIFICNTGYSTIDILSSTC